MAAPEQQVPDPYAHDGPWSEEDFLALPVDTRLELVDGALVMSPSGRNRHGVLMLRIGAALDSVAPPAWRVLVEPNVRLATDRVLIPDIALVNGSTVLDAVTNDASGVLLVVEIVSPGNAAVDRILKPRLYAEAGIRWYLRVEQDGPIGHLHELDGGTYREMSHGPVVGIPSPFAAQLDLPHLAR